jgi:hypothetical protein
MREPGGRITCLRKARLTQVHLAKIHGELQGCTAIKKPLILADQRLFRFLVG